jgi:hypothetical protein
MDADDAPVGRILTRRDVVRLLALGSAGVVVGCSRGASAGDTAAVAATGDTTAGATATRLPGCIVRPELTVGPYFVDNQLDTVGQKFLRGYQITDANGVARFTTIYPGWYRGRTVHIHFKVRTAATRRARKLDGWRLRVHVATLFR